MQRPLVLCTAFAAMLLLAPAQRSIAAADPASSASSDPDLGAFLSGQVAGHLGDNREAADRLLDALAHDPGASSLREPAFLFATLAGDARATALAAKAGPGLISALVLANQAAARGDWARAGAGYAALPGSPLTDAVRPLLLAWALQGTGQTDQALQTLGAVPSGSPFASVAALQAGSIAENAGRFASAGTLFRTAQAVFPSTSLALVQLVGSYLARNGHPAQAAAMVSQLVQGLPILGMVQPGLIASLDRPALGTPTQGLARAYLSIAAGLQEQGPGGKAAAIFMLRFALDLDPGLVAAKLSMAELLAQEHPDEALAVLSGASSDDPLSPLVTLRTATLLAATGHRGRSIAMLQALATSLPGRPEPVETLGDVLSDGKRYAEAIPAYTRAVEDRRRLNDGHLSGDDWQLLFSRAVAYERLDRWPEAKADLDHALALSPNQPYVLNYLGYSLVERGLDLPQAHRLIRRALDAKPDDGSIRDSLGWVMLKQGDIPSAVRTLERAAEQNPEDPTVNFHLGAAYWAAGRKPEAEDQWRWALVLGPDPSDAAQIEDALANAGGRTASGTLIPGTHSR